MHRKEAEQASSPYRHLVFTWAALLLLTAVTVAVASIDLGAFGTLGNLLIASAKAALVLWIFMNLKHESPVLRNMLIVALFTFMVIITLTFSDILFR